MAAAEKVDFRKTMKPYWQPPVGRFVIVEVPVLNFLMIDGRGDPNTAAEYRSAVQWLYALSYALKFLSKAEGRDYVVAPLEGLWWAEDMARFAALGKSDWLWTAMIMQPDWIGEPAFASALTKARGKLGEPPESLRLEAYAEGLCVQTLHMGPYDAEAATIARLHKEFLPENGLVENGHHHEIYLNNPARTAPEKLKTVIRQPVRRVASP